MSAPKLFLGLTGSVASIKVPELVLEAEKRGYETSWHPTDRAEQFVLSAIMRVLRKAIPGLSDSKGAVELFSQYLAESREASTKFQPVSLTDLFSEWDEIVDGMNSKELRSPEVSTVSLLSGGYEDGVDVAGVVQTEKGHVRHINIAEEVSTVLIAPATANTVAKVVHGTTDNFLLEVVRAMPHSKKVHLALAMNTEMLADPATQRNLRIMNEPDFAQKYRIIDPIEKMLQCGTTGLGAMAEAPDILNNITA